MMPDRDNFDVSGRRRSKGASCEADETGLPIVRTVADLRVAVSEWRSKGESIALVPTMGALHEGHLSLMSQGRSLCDRVVVSIFVNPKQFERADDLESYPSDTLRDIEQLSAQGVDLLYLPGVEEIYPPGFATVVSLPGLSNCLCGTDRPGHFDGVSTVVSKLLLQSLPDVAIFGEKDFQQLQIVRRMVHDLNIPVTVRGGATVREADGLALSSRNRLLSEDERLRAAKLYRILSTAVERIAAGSGMSGVLDQARLEAAESGFTSVDYLEIREEDSLALPGEQAGPEGKGGSALRIFAAVRLGTTRLIDNLPLSS